MTRSSGVWNRLEYCGLEVRRRPVDRGSQLQGFVAAISPFNFTAIGMNLNVAPVIMGNVGAAPARAA